MWTWAALVFLFLSNAAYVNSLIQSGRLDEAGQELRRLLEATPGDPVLLNLRGIVEAQLRDGAAAEASFLKALAAGPDSVPIRVNLARVQQQNGKADQALESWQRVARIEPANAEARYQIAYLLMHRGDFDGSLAHLSKLSPKALSRPQALAIRVAAGNDVRALAELKGHPDLTSDDVIGILPVLVKQTRKNAALELLETLRERGLAGRPALEALAAMQEKQGRYPDARQALEQAAQVSGKVDPPLLMALARVAWQQRDYRSTLGYLGQARETQPENAAVHFFFGMTAVALDLPVEAKKSLSRAVELDPENPFYHYACGAVIAQERDAAQSIPHFEHYVRRRPDDVRGRFALAVAYFLANSFDEAKRRLGPLTREQQTAAGAHYFLGRIARHENRLEDAERELNDSLRLLPGQADALAELGYVYTRLRRPELAEKQLALAIEIDRDHYNANNHLLVLYQRMKDPRAEQQAVRVEEVKKKRSEKERALWRTVEIRPY